MGIDPWYERYKRARHRQTMIDFDKSYTESYAEDLERPSSCPACYERQLYETRRTTVQEWYQVHLKCRACGFKKTVLDKLPRNAAAYRTREKA